MEMPADLRLSLCALFVDERHLGAFVPYRVSFLKSFYEVRGSILNQRGKTSVIRSVGLGLLLPGIV